jgi:hypothetical protein
VNEWMNDRGNKYKQPVNIFVHVIGYYAGVFYFTDWMRYFKHMVELITLKTLKLLKLTSVCI